MNKTKYLTFEAIEFSMEGPSNFFGLLSQASCATSLIGLKREKKQSLTVKNRKAIKTLKA